MKNRFLLLLLASSIVSQQSQAQLPMTNFNSGLPANWSRIKVDNNSVDGGQVNSVIVAALATQAWMVRTNGTNDSCMLTASLFSPPGKADRWLITPSFTVNSSNMILSWEDVETISGKNDSLQVWVSPTAGTTVASFTQKIYDGPVTAFNANQAFGPKGAALGAYNGQTIRVAFRNNSYQQGVVRLDNVSTQVLANAIEAGATGVDFPPIVAASASTPVSVSVTNNGSSDITSIQISYKIDNGTPVIQTFATSIPPLVTATLTFTTPVGTTTAGVHTITADILQVNGGGDAVASNNQITQNFSTATQSVARNGLMEEFTSSTCVPCAAFNAVFDPLIVQNNANMAGSKFNIIKYQMNWPSPGNDASYNAHGETRKNYYGVNGIPDHYTNGQVGGSGNQAEINASKTAPSFVDISGSYQVKGDSIIGSVTVTPYITTANATFKLHMAVTEKYYINHNATTTQSEYRHVMRKMFPNGNGTSITTFTANTPQTFTFRDKFTVGNVTQNSHNFWWSPFDGHLIAFLQDDGTKEVLQSVAIPAAWPTDITETSSDLSDVIVYPNPASDFAIVKFNIGNDRGAKVTVLDALGKTVFETTETKARGIQEFHLPVSNLSSGIYQIRVQSAGHVVTQKLTVVD